MSEEQLRAETPPEESHENLVPTSVVSESDTSEVTKGVPVDSSTSDPDQVLETTAESEPLEVSKDSSVDLSTSESDQTPDATAEPGASDVSKAGPVDLLTSESDQVLEATTESEASEVSADSPVDASTSESDQAPEATTGPEASEVSADSPVDASTSESDQAPEATAEPEALEVSEDGPVDTSISESDQVSEATAEPETSELEGGAPVSADPENTDQGAERIGYTGDILGETVSLSDLNDRQESSEAEQIRAEELTQLIDASLSEVVKDEIITGQIISVSDKDVVIDIGFKSDGIIPRNEFEGEVNPGDTLEVYVERLENYHGQLQLSKERAEKVRRWERIEHAFENGTVLEGTITRRIKGGMIVDLIDGLEAFLPGSQIDMRPVRDFDSYLDRKMEFKIVKINADNENVVVSHKALIERDLASQRESILSTMEAGQVLEGVAKNITNFGVFVDLGGVDGLLHITDLTWGRVSHPTEVVSLDENLKVVVLDYDKDRQRISLGLKQLQPHPWENIEERYKPGDVVEGKVVSITDYGAFLEIEQGIEGLVHVSEMSWTGHIRHPSQHVSLGQVVKVSVLSIDHSTKKISLGMKQFETNPWEGISMRYPPGTVLRGRVRNITHFGVFVEIEPGIDGLVHVSDLSWTKTIRHPSEIVKKRQELSVVVLDVDEKRQRIALGHKQIETNPWTNLATVYETGTDHKAKVVRVERKGLTVELPLEVEAFVPIRELRHKSDTGFPPYQEGDEIDLRVIRLDASQKEIVMSETAKQRQEKAEIEQSEREAERAVLREEAKAVRQHAKREKATSGPTTIGELSGLESLKKISDEAS
jgi:small subunit ribosomal protein S1